MYRHVEPYLQGAGNSQSQAAYLVASLFGLHPAPWQAPEDSPWNTSFGWSLRRVRFREDHSDDEGIARRFVATLNCDRPAIGTHLRQLLSLLHSREDQAPVDWEQLYRDIVGWEDADRRVQRRWAEGFWRGGGTAGAQETLPAADSADTTR